MTDKKEKLTKAQLIEKINNERITFKRALEDKDKECEAAVAQVKKAADMVIGTLTEGYGCERNGEYIIEIPRPKKPMVVAAELTDTGYRIRAKHVPEEVLNG